MSAGIAVVLIISVLTRTGECRSAALEASLCFVLQQHTHIVCWSAAHAIPCLMAMLQAQAAQTRLLAAQCLINVASAMPATPEAAAPEAPYRAYRSLPFPLLSQQVWPMPHSLFSVPLPRNLPAVGVSMHHMLCVMLLRPGFQQERSLTSWVLEPYVL